jgi:hypothetical protein
MLGPAAHHLHADLARCSRPPTRSASLPTCLQGQRTALGVPQRRLAAGVPAGLHRGGSHLLRPPPLPPSLASVNVCRRLLPVMRTPAEGVCAHSQPAMCLPPDLLALPLPLQTALLANTLVCLPTGLGKTLIAAVVMHNFARWFPEVRLMCCAAPHNATPRPLHFSPMLHLSPPCLPECPSTLHHAACVQGKVVFVAPTKPLVAQQVEACHSFMGMSKAGFCELTGVGSRQAAAACCCAGRALTLCAQSRAAACRLGGAVSGDGSARACIPHLTAPHPASCRRRELQARRPQGDVAGRHQALLLLHPPDLLERRAARWGSEGCSHLTCQLLVP